MRILLDESLPRKLSHALTGHEVRTVPQMGWAGLKNGELLRRASGQFDVLVTSGIEEGKVSPVPADEALARIRRSLR